MSFEISKTFKFCYGHRLLGDKSKCRHLHGHTAKATIFLQSAKLDERGMVMHFNDLKTTIGAWLKNEIDHVMLLNEKDPLIEMLAQQNERFLKVPFHPTAENIAQMIFDKACEFKLAVTKVELWESDTSRASYAKSILSGEK